MHVAVTGSRGFIGTHLVAALRARGDDVVTLGRGASGAQQDLESDAPLATAIQGADAVVHLAGRTVEDLADPLSTYLPANVTLTEEVMRAAVDAGVTRFVHASSRLVYGPDVQAGAREEGPTEPETFYGLSKLMAEQMVAIYRQKFGIRGVSLRLAQVVGPGDGGRGALPRMVASAVADGRVLIHGAGAAVRDIVHVEDVVGAIVATLVAETPPAAINVGGGQGVSIRHMAEAVVTAIGLSADDIVELPVEREDISHYELDVSRAQHELGWSPTLTLETMVRRLLDDMTA